MVTDSIAALVPPAAPDADLLARFALDRDEAAFAELVRRHGPMVLGVCRGICGTAEADDAFQAAFVVLARKAHSLVGRGALGAWLHGVARRAALKARARALKRRAKEERAAKPEGAPAPEPADALALIEGEVARLPRLYREALVLCGLCGRARKEVADELGVPEGTLASRLAKARELLAQRLKARGVCVPVVTVVVPSALAQGAARAATGAVPGAVAQLATGVIRTMYFNQLRPVALGLGVLAVCAAALVARADAPPAPAGAPTPTDRLEDGVYLMRCDGEGRKVALNDGTPAVLLGRLSPSVGRAQALTALNNDNSQFHLYAFGFDPVPWAADGEQLALVVNGVVLQGEPLRAGGRVAGVRTTVHTAAAAATVARAYGLEPKRRAHPGHRFAVTWTPNRREYAPGAPVLVTMTITNTGPERLRFTRTEYECGARDNQFRFLAQAARTGAGLPDRGGPEPSACDTDRVSLQPGESYSVTVNLSKWFTFDEPNVYRVTGVFTMPVLSPNGSLCSGKVWDDHAVGECFVKVVAPPNPK